MPRSLTVARTAAWLSPLIPISSGIYDVTQQLWGLVLFNTVMTLWCVVGAVYVERNYRRLRNNERWRTAGNRHYPGTGTGTASLTAPGTSYTRWPHSEENPGPRLKESVAEVPILAYKMAGLAYSNSRGPFLQSKFTARDYDYDDDRAHCYASHRSPHPMLRTDDPNHVSPVLNCTCGFYAMQSRSDVEHIPVGMVSIDVELFGRVIVCKYGYRAERQRILSLTLPNCEIGHAGCHRRANKVIVLGPPHPATYMIAACAAPLGLGQIQPIHSYTIPKLEANFKIPILTTPP